MGFEHVKEITTRETYWPRNSSLAPIRNDYQLSKGTPCLHDIAATYFILDDSATSTGTSTRVTSEGSHKVTFYSEDLAGNRETPQTISFKVDKTAPEAKLIFDPNSQSLSVFGIDNLSSTTVQTTATSSTITDQAGHTLQISFTQPKTRARRIALSISKLIYDGVSTSTTASLKYKWNTNTNGTYKMFSAFLSSKMSSLEAHFRPKKNMTIFTTPPTDIDDSDDDDFSDTRLVKLTLPGMVLPYLGTNKGSILIGY
jgi:hypothetical protein